MIGSLDEERALLGLRKRVNGGCTAVDAGWTCGVHCRKEEVPGLGQETSYEEDPGLGGVAGLGVGWAIKVARTESLVLWPFEWTISP
jgi:hypothetical protein